MVTWQIIWLVSVLVGAAIAFYQFRTFSATLIGGLTGGALMGFFGGFVMLVAWTSEGAVSKGNIESGQCVAFETETEIASIERHSETGGSFIIGTGTMDTRMYYFAYINTDDGWYLSKYRRTKTYIVEDAEAPKIVTTNYKCAMYISSWLADGTWSRNHFGRKYIIHVPPNSILREFNP